MKTALFLILALLTARAPAHEEQIPNSTSPDKRFYLTVEEVDAHIYYCVKETHSGRNRISFLSAYQRGPGEFADWSFRQALSAEIHWRDESRCVAIDETNHNRIGTVVIAYRTAKRFHRIPIDRWALMDSTMDPWSKGRLFFGDWAVHDAATVYLIGQAYDDPPTVERRSSSDRSYTFTIDLLHRGRVLARKLSPTAAPAASSIRH